MACSSRQVLWLAGVIAWEPVFAKTLVVSASMLLSTASPKQKNRHNAIPPLPSALKWIWLGAPSPTSKNSRRTPQRSPWQKPSSLKLPRQNGPSSGTSTLRSNRMRPSTRTPTKSTPTFPRKSWLRDGSMVGYYEVLPYAKPVEFTLGADTLLLDDQYCVIPTCSCREAALSFLPLRSSTGTDCSPVGPRLSLRYDYDTGRIESLSTADALGFSGHDFINAFKSAQPDLNSRLAQRHGLLRRLFRSALNRKTLRLSAPKPGRNDPCPCGSGKKFKKCCGV